MRYAFIFLLSLSVLAAEEIQQVSVLADAQRFRVAGANFNRGEQIAEPLYRVIRKFDGAGVELQSAVIQKFGGLSYSDVATAPFNPASMPVADFISYNNALDKPLFFPNGMKWVLQAAPQGSLTFFDRLIPELDLTYRRPVGFVGTDDAVFSFLDAADDSELVRVRVQFVSPNSIPVLSASASPLIIVPGDSTSFLAAATDADGHPLMYAWDFGDGSTGVGAAVTHSYGAAGTYTATVTVNDGFDSVSAALTITVSGVDRLPVPRILTSDVVAFVGLPITFDATASTDPQNALAAYQWDFGDGSPTAVNAIVSKVYSAIGIYTVALTVTDAEGLRQTLTRQLEVLTQEEAATFNGEVRITSTFFPTKEARDTLNIFARVNLGDVAIAEGSTLALTFAGKRFEAQLDKRLRAPGWTVKANLRRLPVGTVEINLRARRASVAADLESAGAEDEALVDVPLRIEAGGKILQIPVETEFEINPLRTRGKAVGEVN